MIFIHTLGHEVAPPTVNWAPTVNTAPPTVNEAPPTVNEALPTIIWAPTSPTTVNVYSRRSRVSFDVSDRPT